MGCVFPKPPVADESSKSNVFKVINIDQEGNGHYPGKIEITSEYLLLYQNKKDPVSWPIRALRRYGFESNIFSFEVGRRCPTGEGIFAFRCNQAEELFRLLQTNIQRSISSSSRIYNDASQQSNYLEPRAVNVRQFRLESVGSANSGPNTPLTPSQTTSNVYNFDKIDTEKSKSEKKDPMNIQSNSSSSSSPVYINVPTNMDENEEPSTSKTAYIYVTEKNGKHYPPPLILPMNNEYNSTNESPKNVKYITLEFDSKASSPMCKTPTQTDDFSSKYTTIDLERTWALSQSTKPNIKNDIGCIRRTRHNSNLFGVYK